MTIKKYSRNFILYAVSMSISKAVPLLLVLLLSHYFKPSEFGLLSLVQALICVFTFLLGGEFTGGVSRKYFASNIERFSICASTSITLILVLNAVVIILVGGYVYFIGNIFSINLSLSVLAALCASSQSIMLILTTTLQVAEKPYRYLMTQTIYGLSFLILILVLYITNTLTVPLFFLLQIMATISAVITNKWLLNDIVTIKFILCMKEIRYLLSYSAPLVIYSLSSFFIVIYLRITVKEVGGLYLVGLFAVAQQMGMLMSNADLIVGKVWTPYAFELLAKDKKKEFFRSSYNPILILIVIFAVLLIVNKLAFMFIISKEFQTASICSIIILFAFFLKSVYSVFVNYAYFYKKTIFVAMINVLIAILSLIFSKYALVHMGLIGAGISMLVSYFFLMVMVIAFIFLDNRVQSRRFSFSR